MGFVFFSLPPTMAIWATSNAASQKVLRIADSLNNLRPDVLSSGRWYRGGKFFKLPLSSYQHHLGLLSSLDGMAALSTGAAFVSPLRKLGDQAFYI